MSLPDGACIIGEEPGTVEGQAFFSLKAKNTYDFGPARRVQVTDDYGDDREEVSQPTCIEVDCTAHGANAQQAAAKLQLLFGSSPAKEFARRHHFSFMQIKPAVNIGMLVGAGYEQRWRVTVEIMYVHKVLIEQASIEEVDIVAEGNYADGKSIFGKTTVKVN